MQFSYLLLWLQWPTGFLGIPAEIGGLCKAMGWGLPGGEDLCERLEIESERKGRPQQVFCSRPGMRLSTGLGTSHGQLKTCI